MSSDAHGPMAGVGSVAQPPPDPDFNVLESDQVEVVARAVGQLRDDELPLMRTGEVDERSLAGPELRDYARDEPAPTGLDIHFKLGTLLRTSASSRHAAPLRRRRRDDAHTPSIRPARRSLWRPKSFTRRHTAEVCASAGGLLDKCSWTCVGCLRNQGVSAGRATFRGRTP